MTSAQHPPHPESPNPSPLLSTSVSSRLFQASVDELPVCDPFPARINKGDWRRRANVGGRRCASRRPLLKQKEWAWAAPLGLAPPPLLAEPGGGGFGRKGKSGGGTELSLIPHSNLPFPHTRPDALKPRAQRGGTQRERLRVLFLCFGGGGVCNCDYFSHFGGQEVRVRLRRPRGGPALLPKTIFPHSLRPGPAEVRGNLRSPDWDAGTKPTFLLRKKNRPDLQRV